MVQYVALTATQNHLVGQLMSFPFQPELYVAQLSVGIDVFDLAR